MNLGTKTACPASVSRGEAASQVLFTLPLHFRHVDDAFARWLRLIRAGSRYPSGRERRKRHTRRMRVLITEDDPSVAAALGNALTRAGHHCTRTSRGADMLAQHREADLVLLDLGLADMDGLDALAALREVSGVPVLVVTARGDERSTVQALRLGADDYLVKPVRLHELLARIAAVARRTTGLGSRILEVGELTIDLDERTVSHAVVPVQVTPTEFTLLTALAKRAGTAVSKQEIVTAVWGDEYASTSRSFDVHLAQLRQKLPMLTITTLRGYGYRLESPA